MVIPRVKSVFEEKNGNKNKNVNMRIIIKGNIEKNKILCYYNVTVNIVIYKK